MTAFYIAAAALALLSAALLTWPLWWPRSPGDGGGDALQTLASQIRQLGELHRAGALTPEQYAESRAAVERRLLAGLAEPVEGAAAPRLQSSPRLALGLAVFIVVHAGGGYRWSGSPQGLAFGPGSGGAAASTAGNDGADAAPHALVPEQVQAMVDQLAQRLKDKPDDADGWQMLARSLVVLGKHAEAVDAFRQAASLVPNDAGLLADYADALAVTQGRRLEGEPTKLVERALAIDATNVKALALAGTAAFDRRDYAGAVRHWEKLVAVGPGDEAFAAQIRAGIIEARALGGTPPPDAASAPAPATAPAPAPGPAPSITGTVSLAAALRGRVAPDDTVFVFARAVEGPRMPLAILRKQVRDLPLKFTLDDDSAMSGSAKLSGVRRVVVGARISKSGNAMPQSGDLQGTIGAVDVGASGLRIEIDQEVTR
jgi:cytochrome c-type biogenesis protein CcmH